LQEKNITRIVADTNVLVSILAAKSLKPLLTLWETEKFKLVFSKETFQELDWVLKRPKFDRWASLEKRELFIKSLLNPYHGIQIISPSKFVEILSS